MMWNWSENLKNEQIDQSCSSPVTNTWEVQPSSTISQLQLRQQVGQSDINNQQIFIKGCG